MSQTGSGETNVTQEKDGRETRVSMRERRSRQRSEETLASIRESQGMLLLFIVILACLTVILTSVLVLKVPAVLACAVMLVEAALILCLSDVPVWLHSLNMIGQIAAGAYCHRSVFMLMCAAFYLFGIVMLGLTKE